jgi:hypothetical protein
MQVASLTDMGLTACSPTDQRIFMEVGMNFQKQNIYKTGTVVILISLFLMAGCAPQFVPSSDKSATSNSSENKAVAKCSKDNLNQSDSSMRLMIYEDTQGIRPDFVRAKIDSLPSKWLENSKNKIQFYKHKFSTTTQTFTSSEVLSFRVEYFDGQKFQLLSAQPFNEISFEKISELVQNDHQNDIQNVVFLIDTKDPAGEAKTMTLALYESSGGAAFLQLTALIPTFYANPKDYADSKPAALAKYHPLNHLIGQGVDFESLSQSFCF